MTLLDLLLSIPLLYFIYQGWRKGLVFEAATLIGLVAGCYAAIHFSKWVADQLDFKGEYALLIAFFVTFVGVVFLSYLLGKMLEGIVSMAHLKVFNHLLGAVLGMCKAVCLLSVLLNWLLLVDRNEWLLTPQAKEQSALFRPTRSLGNLLTAQLKIYASEIVTPTDILSPHNP